MLSVRYADGVRDDVICGGSGKDQLNGGAGNHALFGDCGNDICNVGSGTDQAASCEVQSGIP